MMLIPQTIGLGHNENHKYYVDPISSPPSIAATVPTGGQATHGTAQGIGGYPTGDGYLISGRMQPELPGMNVYSGQPGSSALGSPTNYASIPEAVGSAPGLMPQHYSAGMDHSPYYPSLGSGYDMTSGGGEIWSGGYGQAPPSYYPYENSFGSQYPYDRYCGMDMNDGVRRKNATRESTNTLKAWLQEHKKNPYPTKGEKIMLAIITKMTLTQVSTWFANARRRLKKENKMTWVPKNRSNDTTAGNEKKTDDEDEITSQTHDIDNKSDIDDDTDDSGDREVTSTNNNDVIHTSSSGDSAELPAEKSENYTTSSDNNLQDESEFVSPTISATQPPQLRFSSSESTNRSIWSPANDELAYQADRISNDSRSNISSLRPDYHRNAFSESSVVNRQPSSMMSPSTIRDTEDSRVHPDCRYPQNWTGGSYRSPVQTGLDSTTRLHPGAVPEDVGSSPPGFDQHQFGNIYQRSLPTNEQYTSNPMYNSNKMSEDAAGASPMPARSSNVVTSPYLLGFPHQTHNLPSGDYYGGERLPPPPSIGSNPTYYVQRDLNSQHEASQPDRLHPNYLANAEIHQARTPTGQMVSTASPSPANGPSPVSRQVYNNNHHNVQAPYFASATMTISASPTTVDSMYSQQYYQQQASAAENGPNNVNIYPRFSASDSANVDLRSSPRD